MAPEDTLEMLRQVGIELTYQVNLDRLSPELARAFTQSTTDPALAQFVERGVKQRAGALKTLAFRGLQRMLSDYDAYGLLDMYRMHLLSTEQWRVLLDRPSAEATGALLDIGAGEGGVTQFAQPLFQRICTTERAAPLARMLARRGFEVLDHDLGERPWPRKERFEAVSLLNVLDRTMYPRRLLRHARAVLAPEGVLLISMPLPIRAHVHVGPHTIAPQERLPSAGEGFEDSANAVAQELLAAEGLRVRRLTRLPYLSQGDRGRAFYGLDAALFACVAATPG